MKERTAHKGKLLPSFKFHFTPCLPFTDFNLGGLTKFEILNTSLIRNNLLVPLPVT